MKDRVKISGWILTVVLVMILGQQIYGQTVGEKGPDFEVSLLGGGTFKLSDQLGNVVFVFFFGNTCPSCKAVGPTVEAEIYQAFKNQEDFIAIGLDTWDSSSGEASVTGFKNFTGITFPLAIKAGSVASAYGTTYDRFMVIDRDGVLVHKGIVGASNDVNNTITAISEHLTTADVRVLNSKEAGVKVYPLPASNEISFESLETIDRIRIYNLAGRLLLEDSGSAGALNRTVTISGLEGGLYLYMLHRPDGIVRGKLLIQ